MALIRDWILKNYELNQDDTAFKTARMNTEVKKVPFRSPSCKFLIHLEFRKKIKNLKFLPIS